MLLECRTDFSDQTSGGWSVEADQNALMREEVSQRGEASTGGQGTVHGLCADLEVTTQKGARILGMH